MPEETAQPDPFTEEDRERVDQFKQAIVEAELHPTGSWSRAITMIRDELVEPQQAHIDHLEAALREADELARAASSMPDAGLDRDDPRYGWWFDTLVPARDGYRSARAASASHKEGEA